MVIYGTTDKGIKRSANQDSFFAKEIAESLALVVVCDGMGGAAGGAVASSTAISAFTEKAVAFAKKSYNEETKCFTVSAEEIEGALALAAKCANTAVYEKAKSDDTLSGMGTTLAAAFVTSDILYGINVGDSRIYIFNNGGAIRRLSKDHSLVQYLVDMGEISELEAKYNSRRNIITRAIGIAEDVDCDTFVAIAENSRVLICSDGLTAHLDDSAMEKLLCDFTMSLDDVCNTFITLANQAGGTDNITTVAVETATKTAGKVAE